ncbi:MAG TPA: ATP-binding protein [Actinomycetota bacterium]|nr:ATP-binding protein [Actinomycetota bacterium]
MSVLEEIVARLRDAVIVLDAQRRITGWHGAAARMLGWPDEDVMGKPIDELLQPRDANGNPACIGPCDPTCVLGITTGTPEQEFLVETNGRPELWLGACCSYERDDAGRIDRITVVARDITRRKRVDMAKSEVISAVAHELRSPLTSVKGFTSTLLHRWDRFDDETKKHLLVTIESDADRVTRLIGELLDVSRIEAGRLELRRYPIDIIEISQKVTSRLAPTTANHTLSMSFPPDFPLVYGDPDKLEQVLTNLVENATKHTDAGEIHVTGVVEDGRVRISVADQGEGIPKDHRLAVFGKFFRRNSGRAGSPSGTGLGLFISKGLVEAHGGRIWVESGDGGGGAVFAFTLPVAAPAEPGVPTVSNDGPDLEKRFERGT